MNEYAKIDLDVKYIKLLINIINKQLSNPNYKVYIFGSRVTNKAKKYSDIDLAFDLNRKITIAEIADLRDCFDNSDLPYYIDIIDLNNIEQDFKASILNSSIRLI